MTKTVYDFKVNDIDGNEVNLEDYKGKVLLVVNTASKCGFTPQYTGLEDLYEKYNDQGLEVLGFPCNQFGGQEPGSESEIKEFCQLNFKVKFPLFSKVEVNGFNAHPFFEFLKKEAPGLLGSKTIKWNFTKFLISKNGEVLARFAPADAPEKIEKEIVQLLK